MLNDESIYLYWAQRMVDDPKQLLIPLSEGRQPLFIWLIAWYMHVFENPLLAGRLVSVSAGSMTLLGIFFVSKELFRKNSYAFAASAFYIVSPFALVYDRLALLDSLVAAFTIWSIYFTILLARSLRLDVAYTLGFVIGGGILTKSNGVFNLILLPSSILLLSIKRGSKIRTLFHFVGLLIVVVVTSQIVNTIITVSPQYSRILDVNQIFIIPKKEFIVLPISFIISNFLRNFDALMRYFAEYFTFPYVLLLFVSFIDKSFRREKLLLCVYFLLPLCIFALFGRQLLPRYIYFMTISLFPLCGYGFIELYRLIVQSMKDTTLLRIIFACIVFGIPIVISLSVIRDIKTAFIPLPEKINYASREENFVSVSTKYLNKQAKDKKIVLVIEGYIGWAPNRYQVILHDNQNIEIQSYARIGNKLPKEVIEIAKQHPTYIIIPRGQDDHVSKKLPMEKIIEDVTFLDSEKQKEKYFMRMYKVTSNSSKL